MAALFVAAAASAQTDANFEKFLNTSNATIEDAILKGGEGVAFIGDASLAKEETGKAAGLTVEKATKWFKIDGKAVKGSAAINFVKTPNGIAKKNEIIPTKLPINRAIEVKPTSSGKFQFMVWSKKPAGRLFIGIVNGGKYEQKEILTWEKNGSAGTESNPYETLSYDYQYTEDDIIILHATGPLYMSGFRFSGSTDTAFEGVNPKQLTKKAKKAKK